MSFVTFMHQHWLEFLLSFACPRRNKALIRELSIPPPDSKDLYFTSEYSRSFLTQFKACLWKQNWSYWRNTSYTAVRYVCTIVIALLFGAIFWNLGSKRWLNIWEKWIYCKFKQKTVHRIIMLLLLFFIFLCSDLQEQYTGYV